MLSAAVNPVMPGFAPDPSVDRIGDTFFLVNSTFHMFPGLPIYASKDLVNWTQIGNAINRQSQLSLVFSNTKLHPQSDGMVLLATGGLFAPTIRHHAGTGKTYVINTNVIHPEDGGDDICDNFVVSTDDIWSDKWSDPIWFEFKGIDPSIFWDEDGKAYVCGSRGPGPMTTISLFEMDLSTGKKLSPERTIWKGTGGIYPEGPHVYKKDGWYYLLISEGGTFKDHMITVARSRDIWGPYESHPGNPILTARNSDEYVQCTGHCDMFQGHNGEWWGVCLGVRMRGDRFIMGRESFITPGSWDAGGWPRLQQVVIDPLNDEKKTVSQATDATLQPKKGVDWLYIRDADLSRHQIDADLSGSAIILRPSKADLSQWKEPVTFIGKRQRQLQGRASVVLEAPVSRAAVKAGLVSYKDEHRYARIYLDLSEEQLVFEVINNAKKVSRKNNVAAADVKKFILSIVYTEEEMSFSYAVHSESYALNFELLGTVDTAELSGADFVGPVIGVYATSNIEGTKVVFRDFHSE